ncbi:MAG: hypothetical protein QM767_22130 [Anaeromyxobacter sp.]
MALSTALGLALALSLGGSPEQRLLLCRPRVLGDAALARPEAVPEAGRLLGDRVLDYGVPCEDAAEAARAARRAGLEHAVVTTAEGAPEASRFSLLLTEAGSDQVRARKALEVVPGQDAARPVRNALDELIDTLPEPPGPKPAHVGAYAVTAAGVVAVVVGVVFASQSRAAEDRAAAATDPAAYTHAKAQAADAKRASTLSLVAGGAAVAGGLTWRFAF